MARRAMVYVLILPDMENVVEEIEVVPPEPLSDAIGEQLVCTSSFHVKMISVLFRSKIMRGLCEHFLSQVSTRPCRFEELVEVV